MNQTGYKLFFALLIMLFTGNTKAQIINWTRLQSAKNIARLYGGLEHGAVYGVQYGRVVKYKKFVWIPFADLSLPSGSKVFDDHQIKIGTSAKVFQYTNWIVSADLSIVNRTNENPFVTMQSLASESGVQIGYYKTKWFVNINFSTDNSVLTHLKHSDVYKANYPNVTDGWYHSTANNQLFSVNTGYSLKKIDFTLSAGYFTTDEFKSKPGLPVYAKTGINFRF